MSQIECDHDRKRATELANAARRYSARGRYSMAEESFHKALRLLRNDTSNPECIALWNELGIVLKYGGKYDEA